MNLLSSEGWLVFSCTRGGFSR